MIATLLIMTCVLMTVAQLHDAHEQDLSRYNSRHIYLITADVGTGKPSALSGFRVEGTPGIITCLHGVVNANEITARCGATNEVYENLTISSVDISHDLALLTSQRLMEKIDGFSINKNPNYDSMEFLYVFGYPLLIDIIDIGSKLHPRQPPLQPLRELVDARTRSALSIRNSPSPLEPVLSLEGHLSPGHSGSPILSPDGRVVAVANGGLDKGRGEICWAIPFNLVDWRPTTDRATMMNLSRLRDAPHLLEIFATIDQDDDVKNAIARASGPFEHRGYTPKDANIIINRYIKDKDRFNKYLIHEELPRIVQRTEFAEIADPPKMGSHSNYSILVPKGYVIFSNSKFDKDTPLLDDPFTFALAISPPEEGLDFYDGSISLYRRGDPVLYQECMDEYIKSKIKNEVDVFDVFRPVRPVDAAEELFSGASKIMIGKLRRQFESQGLQWHMFDENIRKVASSANLWEDFKVISSTDLIVRVTQNAIQQNKIALNNYEYTQRVLYINKNKCRLVHYCFSSPFSFILVNSTVSPTSAADS